MRILQKNIDEIKSRIDIVDVISDFINLKKSGQAYKALSPFTDEKTPSFFVVPSKGIYKCFSSGKGGDAISFIMEYDGLSYTEALKYLAGKYGIEIEEREITEEDIKAQNERESLFIILKYATDYFISNLKNSDEGKSVGLTYFKNRGLTEEIIEKFELGYSLEAWDDLYKAAIKQGFGKDIIEKAGLIIKKEEKVYDRFRGRVIFPIYNQTGKVIAFGARTLKKDTKQPKYVNSPETEIYHKSNVLYGVHMAKGPIRKADNCFLVEGYTDVISLHQVGIENVVSSSGTSLTEEQIRLVSRYSENITVLFDGDPAGIKASLRGIDMLLAGGQNVKAVVLPEGHDPDSYSKELGGYEFRKYLEENAHDFITFKINLFVNEAKGDPVKKAATIRDIVESISQIPDPIKRTVYIKESSVLLDIDESVLMTELNKIILKARRKSTAAAGPPIIPIMADTVIGQKLEEDVSDRLNAVLRRKEREIIRSLVRYGYKEVADNVYLYQYLFDELGDVKFFTPVYEEIYNMFKNGLSKDEEMEAGYFLEHGSEQVKSEIVDLITDKYALSNKWRDKYNIWVPREEEILSSKSYTDIERLNYAYIKKLIRKNLTELKNAGSKDDQQKYQIIHMELKKTEKKIASVLGIVISG
ncbi:MAG: DNA primase [Bacteroidetes bacterium]|nr:DNA primase [Bacteroidota bacterium]